MLKKAVSYATRTPYLGKRLPALSQYSYRFLGTRMTNRLIESTVYPLFCGSNDLQQMSRQLNSLHQDQVQVILHMASEHPDVLTIDEYEVSVLDRLHLLKPDDVLAIKLSSLIQRDQLISYGNINSTDNVLERHGAVDGCLSRLIDTCGNNGVKVTIDAEETTLEPAIQNVCRHLMQRYNQGQCHIYHTYQCYLRHTLDRISRDFNHARQHNYHFGVKLVKGAYLEWEQSQPEPKIWNTVEETGDCYLNAVDKLLDSDCPLILATHNPGLTDQILNRVGKPRTRSSDIAFAQLLGLGDQLTERLTKSGHRVYKFVPYGPTEVTFPYLIRRLQENADLLKYV